MSLVAKLTAFAERIAAEFVTVRGEIPSVPAYTGAIDVTPVLTVNHPTGALVWTMAPAFTSMESAEDMLVAGATFGLGGGGGETNLAMGTESLLMNTDGFGNAAVGAFTLSANTTGNYLCAVGYAALGALEAGSDNTAVGTFAGQNLTSGGSNTFVGRSAGSSIATGSNNTILGRYTGGTSSLSNTIIISAGTSEQLRCNSDRNWGFGTSAPTVKVDIAGNAIRVRTAKTPASATAAGDAGTIAWDTNYVYVCVATDTWKRSALSTW